ncbi:MAG: cytochrome c peroxidase [Pseudomonadota bacterium]
MASLELDPARVALGARLFHDPRLSVDNSLACAGCHDIAAGGDDGLQFSKGIDGKQGNINAPTVLNAALGFRQFWNGRSRTLEEQAAGPVENPIEMGADWSVVTAKLADEGDYDDEFRRVFGDDAITRGRITGAIADFERSLLTPAPFDRYLAGDANAISADAAAGYARFKALGCSACHQGMAIGGNLFQKFGALSVYYEPASVADEGRHSVTSDAIDLAVFKVPSLRNVARTAPYFHNGMAPDLPTAIRVMGASQLGRDLGDDDVRLIEAFLHSLSGDVSLPSLQASTRD